MAVGFTTASSQKLEVTSASLPTALPVTIAAWVYLPATPAATQVVFHLGADTSNLCELQWLTTGKLRIRYKDSSAARTADSAALTTPGWFHVLAAYDSLSVATLYIDGATAATTTFPATPTGMDTLTLGNRPAYATAAPLEGRIADIGLWTSLIDLATAATLQTAAPNRVATASLVSYWPLRGGNDNDLVGGLNLTATNGPTVEDGPGTINQDGGEFAGVPHPTWQTSGTQPAGTEGWR